MTELLNAISLHFMGTGVEILLLVPALSICDTLNVLFQYVSKFGPENVEGLYGVVCFMSKQYTKSNYLILLDRCCLLTSFV